MTTKFDICSNVHISMGANAITEFDAEGSVEEQAGAAFYQVTLNSWLSSNYWRHARKVTKLSLAGSQPSTKWTTAYTLPADCLFLRNVVIETSGLSIPYDRGEGIILCNYGSANDVYAVYTYEAPIASWPGYFMALIQKAYAHEACFLLTQNLNLKKALREDMMWQWRFSRNIDLAQQTSEELALDGRGSLTEARTGTA